MEGSVVVGFDVQAVGDVFDVVRVTWWMLLLRWILQGVVIVDLHFCFASLLLFDLYYNQA